MRFTDSPFTEVFIISRLIDWIEIYALSALLQPCNGWLVIGKFLTLKIY